MKISGWAFFVTLLFSTFLVGIERAHAISEAQYALDYQTLVQPFMQTGETFTFKSSDGRYNLSAVRFKHPNPKGVIVVVNGRSEPWSKYGEVFYDLYQQGYSIYSYDHRGQGRSPHLSSRNPQIGHIDYFFNYTLDLNQFVITVLNSTEANQKKYLLAHSMGGAVATEYLELYRSPFAAAVLSAPMLQINTKPYPEKIAKAIVWTAIRLGLGNRYAIGKHDDDCNTAFEDNIVTTSVARHEMGLAVCKSDQNSIIGGPSNRWVNESLKETKYIRAHATQVKTPVLLLQAGNDQLVINSAQNHACKKMFQCTLLRYDDAKHELLMERDDVRSSVFARTLSFFSAF